uniref:Uncharacterized protein n=1 Tax=Peronospora matthiolae TaxID=2874970 RepID=A0AAV1UMA0_9STRA
MRAQVSCTLARVSTRAGYVGAALFASSSRSRRLSGLRNETNAKCVVVKRHHGYETKSDCEVVVVKRHRDDEMKNDDENVVSNVYRHDHANENVVAWHHDFENASGVASVMRHD